MQENVKKVLTQNSFGTKINKQEKIQKYPFSSKKFGKFKP